MRELLERGRPDVDGPANTADAIRRRAREEKRVRPAGDGWPTFAVRVSVLPIDLDGACI